MNYFDDEDEPHSPAVTDLLLFNTHFAGLASPWAGRLYACILELSQSEDDSTLYLSARRMSRLARMTPLRVHQAIAELRRYNAVEILERDPFGNGGYIWFDINRPQEWRRGEDCQSTWSGYLSDVYVLKHGGEYKIGHSGDWQKRVRVLSRKLVGACSVFHTMRSDDAKRLERFWHHQFKHLEAKRKGEKEWFRLGTQELQWIKSLRGLWFREKSPARDLELQAFAYARRFRPEAASTEALCFDDEYYCEQFSRDVWG